MKIRTSLVILSACLLILSFPSFNLWYMAWVSLVPLFFAIQGQRPGRAFLISYVAGILFFLGSGYWLIHVTLPGMIAAVLYLSLYFGLFGFLASREFKRSDYMALAFVPAAWITAEWLRANLLGGFGWSLIAHSQSSILPLIQIADITGAYGVSFLIAVVNVGIFLSLRRLARRQDFTLIFIISSFLVFLTLAYGHIRLNNIFSGERFKAAVIQGNIPQSKKWDANFREEILATYERLTRKAAEDRPDIIIWPESAVPGFLESEKDIFERVKKLVRDIRIPLLIGTPREDPAKKDVYYNSAVLLSPDEKTVIGRYDKMHLVPFGEYIPFKRVLSFVEKIAPIPIGDFSPGKDYTILGFFTERSFKGKGSLWRQVKKVKLGCLICFEDIFPDISRHFVEKGANVLVNITNDAWFGFTGAPYQHAESSVFRAVENRTNVVRAANTGLSCFIDQKGLVTAKVSSGKNDIFVEGYKSHEMVLTWTRTFYNRYGDIFAYVLILSLLTRVFGYVILRPEKKGVK